MTKFKSFLNKYDGKFVEYYDSSNLNQCFDLFGQWLDTLGLGGLVPLGVLNAYQVYDLAKLKPHFDTIPNTPNMIPLEGDVVVWAKSFNGTAGHIGIATGEGDLNKFKCFVQNDPLKSASHVKEYSYNHVLGFMRPKGYQYDELITDDWKKSGFDKVIIGLFQRKLLNTSDSRKFKDNEDLIWIGIDKLIEDEAAHHRGYEEFKTKYANAEEKLLLKENEITHIKEKADNDCKKALADQRVQLLNDTEVEKGHLNRKIDELNGIIKDGVQKIEVPTETPLTDRFKGKTWKEKVLATFEIWGAK